MRCGGGSLVIYLVFGRFLVVRMTEILSCLRVQSLTTICRRIGSHALALDAFDEVCDRMHFRP